MKPVDVLASGLIASKTGIHVVFCLTFVAIFSIPVVLSGNDGIAFAAFCCCLYILFSTYLGRWLGKLMSSRNADWPIALGALAVFTSWTVLGAVGAGLLFKGDYWNHFAEYLAVSFPLVVLFAFLGVSVSLVRGSLARQINDANLRQQQKQSELELLVAQLSPHFLFNTLNNIYGLSITQHTRVPDLLLKLSELLRYSLYQTRQPFIPVYKEITYIKNYIHFERIQTDTKIRFEEQIEEVTDTNLLIAPMLLIVFVENAFKHSRHAQSGSRGIRVNLNVRDSWLYFEVCNTCPAAIPYSGESSDSPGMGLNHTLRRLELIYGNDFRYDAEKQGDEYKMKLALKMKTP